MDSLKLQSNDHTYDILFSYKCFRLLGQKWGLAEYTAVIQAVAAIGENLENLSFEAIDKIGEVIVCGILAGANPEDAENFDADNFMNDILQDLEKLAEIFQYLGTCMPKNKTTSEKTPAMKPKKSKPSK